VRKAQVLSHIPLKQLRAEANTSLSVATIRRRLARKQYPQVESSSTSQTQQRTRCKEAPVGKGTIALDGSGLEKDWLVR